MIPPETFKIVGSTTIAAAHTRDPDTYFGVTGNDLNDLAVLALRMNFRCNDSNELRDWQNRINLILSNAVVLKQED